MSMPKQVHDYTIEKYPNEVGAFVNKLYSENRRIYHNIPQPIYYNRTNGALSIHVPKNKDRNLVYQYGQTSNAELKARTNLYLVCNPEVNKVLTIEDNHIHLFTGNVKQMSGDPKAFVEHIALALATGNITVNPHIMHLNKLAANSVIKN